MAITVKDSRGFNEVQILQLDNQDTFITRDSKVPYIITKKSGIEDCEVFGRIFTNAEVTNLETGESESWEARKYVYKVDLTITY